MAVNIHNPELYVWRTGWILKHYEKSDYEKENNNCDDAFVMLSVIACKESILNIPNQSQYSECNLFQGSTAI